MNDEVRISSSERDAMAAMHERGGSWSAGTPALWESRHWTLVLLKSLVGKGMVREVVPDVQYELTPAGMVKADEHDRTRNRVW